MGGIYYNYIKLTNEDNQMKKSNGRGGYYPKKTTQVPWRQQSREFPYPKDLDVMLEDPQYIKDKKELMNEHGNGWWWTCPYGNTQGRYKKHD